MAEPFDVNSAQVAPPPAAAGGKDWLRTARTLVESLNYGSVQIVIQDSRVVQIESTEKIRLDQPQPRTHGRSTRRPFA